ncbi:geranylgeranyl diphosphate synthase, type II [Alkalithermobacter thermoalcaliphilus JW-YL-7 = DSM 7308]|uniref:Farnesyl diphosphate synthase n=1 Tax=Alkalithermobacter thermoalcaliphilus JW-YL-7 = DSM 7308 TaxID=1121328 RepID=A0A150FPV3_CLOPD|nr:Polyprenyl synthetase [[Clostridium] paradoxum JW-YL-7 = DSM 7308]SHK66164.1 geranylgeranyl diphosphate synthase, type II [[Clostridium] paradoxum JW-YL-7 = DSM 7308]
MNFKDELKQRKIYFEKTMNQYIPQNANYQKTLFEAMKYSLDAGGKRLRPLLMMESCSLVGGNVEDVIPFANAIEMIHTYSLIHDDLPCMDDDDLRRGKPTNHKVFGEGIAVLAGDGLLNLAFEVMIKASLSDKKNSYTYLQAMNEIAKASGVYGMIGGQAVDLECENKLVDKDTLEFIHMNKTSAMIIASMRSGAIIGKASDEQLDRITNYARCIGLSFQIVDDILDIVGDQSKLGKNIKSDLENNKSTYPSLYGLDKSKQMAQDLIKQAKESISLFGEKAQFLIDLADYIISREC